MYGLRLRVAILALNVPRGGTPGFIAVGEGGASSETILHPLVDLILLPMLDLVHVKPRWPPF